MAKKNDVARKLDDLELIRGVEALPPQPQPEGKSRVAASEPAELSSLPSRDLELFRQGGWTFVKDAASQGEDMARPLFRDSDGHVKIDSGSISVRFAEDVSERDIEALLGEHGLKVGRKLGFAPNLFTVRPMPGRSVANSVEIAKALSKSNDVEYAEPVLIEALEKR